MERWRYGSGGWFEYLLIGIEQARDSPEYGLIRVRARIL